MVPSLILGKTYGRAIGLSGPFWIKDVPRRCRKHQNSTYCATANPVLPQVAPILKPTGRDPRDVIELNTLVLHRLLCLSLDPPVGFVVEGGS